MEEEEEEKRSVESSFKFSECPSVDEESLGEKIFQRRYSIMLSHYNINKELRDEVKLEDYKLDDSQLVVHEVSKEISSSISGSKNFLFKEIL